MQVIKYIEINRWNGINRFEAHPGKCHLDNSHSGKFPRRKSLPRTYQPEKFPPTNELRKNTDHNVKLEASWVSYFVITATFWISTRGAPWNIDSNEKGTLLILSPKRGHSVKYLQYVIFQYFTGILFHVLKMETQ